MTGYLTLFNMTKEAWVLLTPKSKEEVVKSWLDELIDIDNNTHKLSAVKESGRLSKVKKDLSTLIIDVVTWESEI